ncbi:hypothetical protein DPEC_G00108610 [Dallia pectoralis]|uniref:Uncharacterized protein n=1 Tax=Dallia pectoralis TaxID=75939 RepID=A0ACC2GS55_DALPE|nr:hypothetical protein DPEC_G00108610 [Dallia pectoralis]
MDRRRRVRPGEEGGDCLRAARKPRYTDPCTEGVCGVDSITELPHWMRLYFYGMHGVTLDVLISCARGVLVGSDPKLIGFSSPYLCVMHSLSHFVLEKIYAQKKRFQGRPVVFHLVFYPSVYIGLQILIGNISTQIQRFHIVSVYQIAVHYLLALYFSQVFHRGLGRLRCYGPGDRTLADTTVSPLEVPALRCYGPGDRTLADTTVSPLEMRALPGVVRFLFFAMHGFLDEIVFTSVFNLVEKSDRTMSGHTSLWSFLMYGSCSFVVEKLYMHLHFQRGWSTWRRLPIYVCFIYTWELCWGLVLREYGACSWDYSHYPFNFMGLITLVYLPGWVCISLYQDVLSNVLLRVMVCKDGEETVNSGQEVTGANGHHVGRDRDL